MEYKEALAILREYLNADASQKGGINIDEPIRTIVNGFEEKTLIDREDMFVLADVYEQHGMIQSAIIGGMNLNKEKPGSVSEEDLKKWNEQSLTAYRYLKQVTSDLGYHFDLQVATDRLKRKLAEKE